METNAGENLHMAEIKVYKYRWIILLIFCLVTVISFMQMMQFAIISNIMTDYYKVDSTLIDATTLIFFVAYILLFLPISYSIEKYNLRISIIIGMFLTVTGTVVKIFCNDPDRIYVAIIGQGLAAISLVYILSVPTKVASVWFGAEEVSTACAIAVLGTQLGTAVGALLPPFFIDKNQTKEEMSFDIRIMNIYYAVIASIVFIIVVLFFRSKPKHPPSQSQFQLLTQTESQLSFSANCKEMIKNKDCIFSLIFFGIFTGIWNSFGVLVNKFYIHYFPDGETDIGIISLTAIILGGCFGSLIFGLILDKTHAFKKTSFGVMLISALTLILVFCTLEYKMRIATFFSIPLFGFFAASVLLFSLEYILEITYPVPESVSCSVMNAVTFFFAIIGTLVIEALIDAVDYMWTFVFIFVLLLGCSFGILLISAHLKRREANLLNQENGGIENNAFENGNAFVT